MAWIASRWGRAVGLCAGSVLAGCAITPQPMFGSDIKVGTLAPGPAWGTSFGASESRIIGSDGSAHVIRGNGDSVLGYPPAHLGLVVPVAAVVRAAVLPRLDVGAHIGWYGTGTGARFRLSDPDAAHSFYLSADAQVGYALPKDDRTHDLGRPYAGRVQVETALSGLGRWQLLGAMGVSAGYRRHGVDASSFMSYHSIDRIFGAENTLAILRAETRLEGGIGFAVRIAWRIGLQVMVMSYVVLADGSPQVECLNCAESATLVSFQQRWGFSVLLNPFIAIGGPRPPPWRRR
jgi:hypothetical protein